MASAATWWLSTDHELRRRRQPGRSGWSWGDGAHGKRARAGGNGRSRRPAGGVVAGRGSAGGCRRGGGARRRWAVAWQHGHSRRSAGHGGGSCRVRTSRRRRGGDGRGREVGATAASGPAEPAEPCPDRHPSPAVATTVDGWRSRAGSNRAGGPAGPAAVFVASGPAASPDEPAGDRLELLVVLHGAVVAAGQQAARFGSRAPTRGSARSPCRAPARRRGRASGAAPGSGPSRPAASKMSSDSSHGSQASVSQSNSIGWPERKRSSPASGAGQIATTAEIPPPGRRRVDRLQAAHARPAQGDLRRVGAQQLAIASASSNAPGPKRPPERPWPRAS